jgi:hypothetical protein
MSRITGVSAKQEEEMKFTNFAVATVALGLMLGSAAAYATDEDATVASCVRNATATDDAMKANSTSANLDAARAESRAAHNYCTIGLYKVGIEHYKKALSLLTAG